MSNSHYRTLSDQVQELFNSFEELDTENDRLRDIKKALEQEIEDLKLEFESLIAECNRAQHCIERGLCTNTDRVVGEMRDLEGNQ